jgi:hypothetical protein
MRRWYGSSDEEGVGTVGGVEAFMGFVRSSVKVPNPRCCWRVASTAEELGDWTPNPQMTFCFVSEFACENMHSC